VIDLTDQLVDALRDVLAALMRLSKITFQGLDALDPGRELPRRARFSSRSRSVESISAVTARSRRSRSYAASFSAASATALPMISEIVHPQTFRIVPFHEVRQKLRELPHTRRLNSSISRKLKPRLIRVCGWPRSD
jgi:hypothetical protein